MNEREIKTVVIRDDDTMPADIENELMQWLEAWSDHIEVIVKGGLEYWQTKTNTMYEISSSQLLRLAYKSNLYITPIETASTVTQSHIIIKNGYVFYSLSKTTATLHKLPFNILAQLNVGKNGSSIANIKVSITLTKERENELETQYGLTPYDVRVLNAFYTLFLQGKYCFSIADIAYCIGQRQALNENQRNKIKHSLEVLSNCVYHLDNTEEAKAYKNKVKKFIIHDNLIRWQRITAELNTGQVYEMYKIVAEPAYLTYLIARRQFITIPVIAISSKKMTESNIELQNYLLREINLLKPDKRGVYKLSFEAIYKELQINEKNEKDKKARYRIKDKVKPILDNFKKTKLIATYRIEEKHIIITKCK